MRPGWRPVILPLITSFPRGLTTCKVEATNPFQVEVKSRQDRLGPFPVGVAAEHVVDAWAKHSARFGTERRLVVVFEQGLVASGLVRAAP